MGQSHDELLHHEYEVVVLLLYKTSPTAPTPLIPDDNVYVTICVVVVVVVVVCVSPEGDHPDINTGDNGATAATGAAQLDPS